MAKRNGEGVTGGSLLDGIHRILSRSAWITRAAIALRNQSRAVIKHRLMTGASVSESGEVWVASNFAPQCATFVDVGANVGEWSEMFLRYAPPAVRGILFEPGVAAANELRRRIDRPGVEIVPAAVSDREAERGFFFEEPDAGTLSSLNRSAAPRTAVRLSVRITTLDAAMHSAGIPRIDFLKIDTEGHDLHVLRGAAGLLQANAIDTIQFEYGDAWMFAGGTLAAAVELLSEHGYTTYLLKSGGLYRFHLERFGEFFTFANFVAFSRERQSTLHFPVRELL